MHNGFKGLTKGLKNTSKCIYFPLLVLNFAMTPQISVLHCGSWLIINPNWHSRFCNVLIYNRFIHCDIDYDRIYCAALEWTIHLLWKKKSTFRLWLNPGNLQNSLFVVLFLFCVDTLIRPTVIRIIKNLNY